MACRERAAARRAPSVAPWLPIVTAQTAGGAEVVTPECGTVIPNPDDAEALAEALRPMLSDPARRTALGKASREIALRHSWEQMAETYLKLYREVGA